MTMLLIFSPTLIAQEDGLNVHADYYFGFSQGVYYGLMLAGIDYDIAWCVKSELDYEGENMGTGGEFQTKLEGIHKSCRGSE